ncbi:MAG: hypothetical protein J2P26_00960 [Nocardiopsaceae bacterium]|nr:hypothetical protein [Nocardiopsaceae bacterium]
MFAGQHDEAFGVAEEAGRRLEALDDRVGLLCHDAQMGYLLMMAGVTSRVRLAVLLAGSRKPTARRQLPIRMVHSGENSKNHVTWWTFRDSRARFPTR